MPSSIFMFVVLKSTNGLLLLILFVNQGCSDCVHLGSTINDARESKRYLADRHTHRHTHARECRYVIHEVKSKYGYYDVPTNNKIYF